MITKVHSSSIMAMVSVWDERRAGVGEEVAEGSGRGKWQVYSKGILI